MKSSPTHHITAHHLASWSLAAYFSLAHRLQKKRSHRCWSTSLVAPHQKKKFHKGPGLVLTKRKWKREVIQRWMLFLRTLSAMHVSPSLLLILCWKCPMLIYMGRLQSPENLEREEERSEIKPGEKRRGEEWGSGRRSEGDRGEVRLGEERGEIRRNQAKRCQLGGFY